MDNVYAVLRDGGGAHEPTAIMSLWTSLELADVECENLNTWYYKQTYSQKYNGYGHREFYIDIYSLNKPSFESIN